MGHPSPLPNCFSVFGGSASSCETAITAAKTRIARGQALGRSGMLLSPNSFAMSNVLWRGQWLMTVWALWSFSRSRSILSCHWVMTTLMRQSNHRRRRISHKPATMSSCGVAWAEMWVDSNSPLDYSNVATFAPSSNKATIVRSPSYYCTSMSSEDRILLVFGAVHCLRWYESKSSHTLVKIVKLECKPPSVASRRGQPW